MSAGVERIADVVVELVPGQRELSERIAGAVWREVGRVLDAAHDAADDLDEWDGHPSPNLGGCSPGGVVRHLVHDAAGVDPDTCPACARYRTDALSGAEADGAPGVPRNAAGPGDRQREGQDGPMRGHGDGTSEGDQG